MVGLTEEMAKNYNIDYEIGRFAYLQNARGIIIGDTSGLIKLIISASDQVLPPSITIPGLNKSPDGSTNIAEQQLLGVHIIGESATELIHIGLACLYYHGTIDYFIQSVFNFPTLAEAFKYAAYDGFFKIMRKKSL
jgi:NAD(P) transhydrogenase